MSAISDDLAINFDAPDSKFIELVSAGDLYKIGEELYKRGTHMNTGTNTLKAVSLKVRFLNTDLNLYVYEAVNSYTLAFPQLGFKLALDKDTRIIYISNIFKTSDVPGSEAFGFATGFGKLVLKADGFTLIDAAVINCETDGQVPLSLSRIFQGKKEPSWYNALASKEGLKLGYAEKNAENHVKEAITALQTLSVGDVFVYIAEVLDFLLMKPSYGYIVVKNVTKPKYIPIAALEPKKSPFSNYEAAYLLLAGVKDKTQTLGTFLQSLRTCEERSAIYEILPTAHRIYGIQYVDRFQTGFIPTLHEFPQIAAFYTILETHVERKYLVGGGSKTRRTRRRASRKHLR